MTTDAEMQEVIKKLINWLGDDLDRPGLLETPARVVSAWKEWCSGYGKDPSSIFKSFEDGAEDYDQMILVKEIPFYSHCEHHLAPIFGRIAIGYIPDGRVVGLSKLSRLVDIYARRLQVQERLTNQIAEALYTHLKPKGVAVMVSARHLCMESRGINRTGSITVTTALRGVLRTEAKALSEFYSMTKL